MNSKKNTVTSFHQIKCSNRNISSLTMERHWPQLVLNKKFATLSEQSCRHILILLYYDQQLVEIRTRVPLPSLSVSSVVAGGKNSLAGRLSHWKALPFWLVFLFLQKAPVWEITGAEFRKSTTHTADGISIRFPRVTRIRGDKDWKTANDLPHLRVSWTGSIPGRIQDNCSHIGHCKIF